MDSVSSHWRNIGSRRLVDVAGAEDAARCRTDAEAVSAQMIPLTLAACLLVAPLGICRAEVADVPAPAQAWASQYAPGVAERVIRQQQRWAHLPATLPDVDGYIAVIDCSRLGEVWQMRPVGADEWDAMLVIDCSGHVSTTQWMSTNGIICEVDAGTVTRWNAAVGRGIRVEVLR